MSDYQTFLASKLDAPAPAGIDVTDVEMSPVLFPFQRDVVRWALRRGRALVGLDTGLGKTFVQVEWARIIAGGARALIIAPLSVARQTVRESAKLGVVVRYVRDGGDVEGDGLYITNYEMADSFDPECFRAVVLDESSILKSLDGATRKMLTARFANVPYRLCCTATPAPNSEDEIGMHAEFLGVKRHTEMLGEFFIHANKVTEEVGERADGTAIRLSKKASGDKGQEWRLRNHGRKEFYRWLASWAMTMTRPSDLGYSDDGFILPQLTITPHFVDAQIKREGQLFFTGLHGIGDRAEVRCATLADRVRIAAALVNGNDDQWIVWCGLQAEADAMTRAIPGAVEVRGSDTPEQKAQRLEDFQDGKYRVLVTKPRIAGFGMNFQNAHRMVFVGLNDSWEAYYQCIRREWRFGQAHPVQVDIVMSEAEREIYDNVMRKEAMAAEMKRELIAQTAQYEKEELAMRTPQSDEDYYEETSEGANYRALLGDSSTRLGELDDDSVDLSVYSPPFADLYTYSDSARDLGNSRGWGEFFAHYAYILRELYRVHKPGTESCVHVADIPALAVKDGYIGLRDFPGAVIRAHEEAGWVYHGWAVVAKNPQAQAIRTKAKALLFVQLKKDSSHSRPAILDRILIFKKPGERDNPVTPVERGEIDNERWIDWASGIWTGISESDTLQYTTARDPEDEKHICPLQLGTIERCIKLYSNPGETVLTPFMGIGSEAYQALKFGRRAIGIELKPSYYRVALQNLRKAEADANAVDLFAWAAQHADETA